MAVVSVMVPTREDPPVPSSWPTPLLLRRARVTIERVMTDNALNYRRSNVSRRTLERLSIAHRRTANYRPRTNGKAERFNRTLLEEFAYRELFTSNDARSAALGPWVDSYKINRPHTAIGGLTPVQRLIRNADGNHTWLLERVTGSLGGRIPTPRSERVAPRGSLPSSPGMEATRRRPPRGRYPTA